MGVGCEVFDDLLRSDAGGYGGLDGGFCDLGGNEVGVAGVESAEEGEDGDEEG